MSLDESLAETVSGNEVHEERMGPNGCSGVSWERIRKFNVACAPACLSHPWPFLSLACGIPPSPKLTMTTPCPAHRLSLNVVDSLGQLFI